MNIKQAAEGFIQVLWVEDDPKVTEAYPLEAEDYGIQLVHFPYWDEAKIALTSQFKRWEAIIFDAKCKVHSDSHDNAVCFLGNVFPDLTSIYNEKGRNIPWYVLSGGSETEIPDSIPESRSKWDGDWPSAYYRKSTDRKTLFERIKKQVNRAPAMHIQEKYKDVFTAISACGIQNGCYELMEDLLLSVHYPQLSKDNNSKFKNVRLIIESIFRHMMIAGFLPEQDRVNLDWSCRILSGLEIKDREKKNTIAKGNIRLVPIIIGDNIREMYLVSGAYLHTESGSDKNTKNTISYLQSVGNSCYLIQSYALQLCDIILWYALYYADNHDQERNRLNWEIDKEAFYK